jgi:hypothetical protein
MNLGRLVVTSLAIIAIGARCYAAPDDVWNARSVSYDVGLQYLATDPAPAIDPAPTMIWEEQPAWRPMEPMWRPGEYGARDPCLPRWFFRADAMILDRIGSPDVTLVRDVGSGAELLNAHDLDFPFAAGPRFSMQRQMANGWGVELAYFGIDGWSRSRTGESAGGVMFSAPGVTLSGMVPLSFDWDSRLYNAEVNLRLPERWRLTPFVGFRWLELNEELRGDFVVAPPFTFWSTHARNQLYGVQIGTDVRLWDNGGPIRIEGVLKVGAFANHAHQASTIPWLLEEVSAQTDQLAFVGDLGLTGSWQIRNWLALRAGYHLLWLEGVALPPAQIALSDVPNGTAGIDAHGGVFYHGATAGLEVRF